MVFPSLHDVSVKGTPRDTETSHSFNVDKSIYQNYKYRISFANEENTESFFLQEFQNSLFKDEGPRVHIIDIFLFIFIALKFKFFIYLSLISQV